MNYKVQFIYEGMDASAELNKVKFMACSSIFTSNNYFPSCAFL